MRRGVAAVVVVVLAAVAGLVGYWYAVAAADRELAAALVAHRAGDCGAAVAGYRPVSGPPGWDGVATEERRAAECDDFLAAEDLEARGDVTAAAAAYDDYAAVHPDGLLLDLAADRAAALRDQLAGVRFAEAEQRLLQLEAIDWASGPDFAYGAAIDDLLAVQRDRPSAPAAQEVLPALEEAVGRALAPPPGRACGASTRLDTFAVRTEQELAPLADRARAGLPRALFDCGMQRNGAGDHTGAVVVLDRLVTEFPGDPLAGEARTTLITARIAAAQGAGELPPPAPVGSAPGGTVTVEIINDSPDGLELLHTGPVTGEVGVGACGTCTSYPVVAPVTACPTGAEPTVTLVLPPGSYSLLVESVGGGGVTPYAGTWELEPGVAYESCFFIVESFLPLAP